MIWHQCRYLPHNRRILWALIGSHNISCGAWGRLLDNGKQLNIAHHELRWAPVACTCATRAGHCHSRSHSRMCLCCTTMPHVRARKCCSQLQQACIMWVTLVRVLHRSVLFLPSLEAVYRTHPHFGFNCTPTGSSGNAQGSRGVGAAQPTKGHTAAAAAPSLPMHVDSGCGGEVAARVAAGQVMEFHPLVLRHASTAAGSSAAVPPVDAGPQTLRVLLPLPFQLPPTKYSASDMPYCQVWSSSGCCCCCCSAEVMHACAHGFALR